MSNPTPAEFIAALRSERDPNWSDVQHLLELVWAGEVGDITGEPSVPVIERKFYRKDWSLPKLLEARNGGLITDTGEAWTYRYSSKDGVGGEYDMLMRRDTSSIHSVRPTDTHASTAAIAGLKSMGEQE